MKFAEHLLAHITPEWRRQYIVYEDMKTILYEAVENLPTIETTDPQEIIRLTRAFDEDFLAFCEKELFKINVFYEEKLAEAKRKFDALKKEMDALALEQQQHQQQLIHQQQSKGSLFQASHANMLMLVPTTRSSFVSTINLRQRNSFLHQQSQQTQPNFIPPSQLTLDSTSSIYSTSNQTKNDNAATTTTNNHNQDGDVTTTDPTSNDKTIDQISSQTNAKDQSDSDLMQQPAPYISLDDGSVTQQEQLSTNDTTSLIVDNGGNQIQRRTTTDAINNDLNKLVSDNRNSDEQQQKLTESRQHHPPPPYHANSTNNKSSTQQQSEQRADHDRSHQQQLATMAIDQYQLNRNKIVHLQQRRSTKPRLSISAASAANLIKSPLSVLKSNSNTTDTMAWDVAIIGKESDDEQLIKASSHIDMHPLAVRPGVDKKKLHDLKLAFSEFYLSLVLLQNYQRLNFTGFRKIFKKHDKLLGNEVGKRWHREHVECAFFNTNKDVDKLIEETENIVTCHLEAGDRQRAMKRLRVPPLNDTAKPWTVFRVGFFSGAFIMLIFAVIFTGLFQQTGDDWRIVFRLYRSSLFIVIFIFLVGINVYGWRAHGVNHVLIFELDPRDHLGAQDLLEISFTFGVLWSISVLIFLWSGTIGIPPLINPLILNSVMILYLLNPTKTCHHSARIWLLSCLGRIVAAPFYRVRFADFWLADQLNSLVPVLLDIEYTSCFYLTSSDLYGNIDLDRCVIREPRDLILRSIVACLPAWWRFAQCVRRYFDENRRANPHLLNAGKYATVWMVVMFSTVTEYTQDNYTSSTDNPFFFCWIASLIFSSCYTYTWDIKMDWGLGDPKAPKEYIFLREEIVYPARYYYVAIVQDLIFRFGWTLSVSLTEVGAIPPDLITLVLAPCEIFRRFVWNFYRLENEHLNNCGEFRAVRDISISGQNIDLSALNRILKVMDEPDGLAMFRKRMKSRMLAAKKKALVESLDPSVVLIM